MTSVGDYDLEQQIGAGASGTVWRARHRGPVTRVVALKRLRAGGSPAELTRMRREATVLTELDHPHIVRVLEVVQDGDGVALAMQFAPGGSLADLLAERGRLTPGQLVAVAAPIAGALASAHRRGVLHGDVKPANVLFTSDGEPLLTDFGVARTLGQVTSDHIAGTAEYLAPELLDGAQPDVRADIYSLGVACYEALTGRPPYTGAVPLAVVRAAALGAHEPLEAASGVPAPLARAVSQAMARQPQERFGSADEFARVLRTTVPAGEVRVPGPTAARPPDGEAGTGPTRTFGPRPPRPDEAAPGGGNRRRLVVLAVVAVAILGLVGLVRGPLASDDDDPAPRADCPDAPIPGLDAPDAQVVEGDVAGDGCVVVGVYGSRTLADGSTAMVLAIDLDGAPEEIGLGTVGDQVVLGDWDCDGADTPALYQSAAGVVQYFDLWPLVEQRTYPPSRTEQVAVGGTASLGRGEGDDCDSVSVEAGAGEAGPGGGARGGGGATDASVTGITEMVAVPRPNGLSR